ncbi:MAG: helix-turn-helix transcriptional regulator [Solirubrobacteraceae bacterium]
MHPRTAEQQQRLFRQARLLVERHYAKPLTLPALAEALASSPRQIQRAFRDAGGMTFREALQECRMTAAAELLAQRAIPIADVARLVGYRQHSHFSRVFRRCYKIAPAGFRAEALGRTRDSDVMLKADDRDSPQTANRCHGPAGGRRRRGAGG